MSLVVDVTINGSATEAIVDTAAMVTLISEKYFRSLGCHNIQLGQNVLLKGLSNNPICGQFVNNVNIKLGPKIYSWNVCVAPMTDNIILGIDFLKAFSAVVDLGKNIVCLGEHIIPGKLKIPPDNDPIQILRVHVAQKATIPPHTVGFVKGKVASNTVDGTQLFEPLPQRDGILLSAVLVEGKTFNVKVINDSDGYFSLKKGRLLGSSEPCSPLTTTPFDVKMGQKQLNLHLITIPLPHPLSQNLKSLYRAICVTYTTHHVKAWMIPSVSD